MEVQVKIEAPRPFDPVHMTIKFERQAELDLLLSAIDGAGVQQGKLWGSAGAGGAHVILVSKLMAVGARRAFQ